MITALTDLTDDIYIVLPAGALPIFRPRSVDPGSTASTGTMVSALIKHYGYQETAGGKGSPVKLRKPGARTITLPGNRTDLTQGILKYVLEIVVGTPVPLSRLPELIEGTLQSISPNTAVVNPA